MKIKTGDIWISESHPHESFHIYAGVIDTCEMEYPYPEIQFDEFPEKAKVLFWRRHDDKAYEEFLTDKLGKTSSTYPYAYCGECKKTSLAAKIKKYNMKLSDDRYEVEYTITK